MLRQLGKQAASLGQPGPVSRWPVVPCHCHSSSQHVSDPRRQGSLRVQQQVSPSMASWQHHSTRAPHGAMRPVVRTQAVELAAETATTFQPLSDLAEAVRLFIPGIVGDNQLREGFVSAFLLIFFSEIGDKTFFIALLLALRNPQLAVFTGTFSALAIMTVISVLLGQALHLVDEVAPLEGTPLAAVPFDDVLAAVLLVYFGIKAIQDAGEADSSAAEEKEEAEEVVQSISAEDLTKLILTTFTLVFAAEWGDKSFLATIALAAASSPVGVTGGAVAGHGVATALAVAGGSVLTRYFSASLLQYVGGGLFLVFAAATLVDIAVEMTSR